MLKHRSQHIMGGHTHILEAEKLASYSSPAQTPQHAMDNRIHTLDIKNTHITTLPHSDSEPVQGSNTYGQSLQQRALRRSSSRGRTRRCAESWSTRPTHSDTARPAAPPRSWSRQWTGWSGSRPCRGSAGTTILLGETRNWGHLCVYACKKITKYSSMRL